MSENWQDSYDVESDSEREAQESISVEQLRHLVQLLDQSDVSEIELKRASEGTRLVLRKAKAPESVNVLAQPMAIPTTNGGTDTSSKPPAPVETKQTVVAPLVGIFHVWAKPKGAALVVVGDRVKAGQLVGTISSLNVLNEVETSKAGRVVEILVQEGQAVEYGQPLMYIETAEGA
jgi:acetyl-CoA carboxylase biotin carboxyl carrier protein